MTTEVEISAIDAFIELLPQISKSKVKLKQVNEILSNDHGFMTGYFNTLILDQERLASITDEQFIPILIAVYSVYSFDLLNPSKYYSKEEIKIAKEYKIQSEDKISLPYTFKGVLKGSDGNYLTMLSYREIFALYNSKLLTYNYDTQRIAKRSIRSTGEIVQTPTIKLKSVESIYKLMKEHKYEQSTILLNVLEDGNSEIEYSDGNLTVLKGSEIDIIDGMHRIMAIIRIMSEFPEYEGFMNVDIKNFSLSKAQELLSITNTVNPFDRSQRLRYANATYGSEITRELEKLTELKNRISPKSTPSKTLGELTTFAIMSESIDDTFELNNSKDKYVVTNQLKKFYSYFLSYFEDEFKNYTVHLETSWLTYHNMFVVYNILAKKIFEKYGDDFTPDTITSALSRINFNKNQDTKLNTILQPQGKVNAGKIRKQLKEFAEKEIVVE